MIKTKKYMIILFYFISFRNISQHINRVTKINTWNYDLKYLFLNFGTQKIPRFILQTQTRYIFYDNIATYLTLTHTRYKYMPVHYVNILECLYFPIIDKDTVDYETNVE